MDPYLLTQSNPIRMFTIDIQIHYENLTCNSNMSSFHNDAIMMSLIC